MNSRTVSLCQFRAKKVQSQKKHCTWLVGCRFFNLTLAQVSQLSLSIFFFFQVKITCFPRQTKTQTESGFQIWRFLPTNFSFLFIFEGRRPVKRWPTCQNTHVICVITLPSSFLFFQTHPTAPPTKSNQCVSSQDNHSPILQIFCLSFFLEGLLYWDHYSPLPQPHPPLTPYPLLPPDSGLLLLCSASSYGGKAEPSLVFLLRCCAAVLLV